MGKSQIDQLTDAIEWTETPLPSGLESGEVYATHSGKLVIGSLALRVYQLSDGTRVIDGDDLHRAFGFEP